MVVSMLMRLYKKKEEEESKLFRQIRSVSVFSLVCVLAEMTVGKDQEVTVKSKGAGGQGKVAAKVTGPGGKPVSSKV